MATEPNQVHLRLSEEVSKQVDRYARFVKEATGVEVSRTDAVMALVRRGIVAWDADAPKVKR